MCGSCRRIFGWRPMFPLSCVWHAHTHTGCETSAHKKTWSAHRAFFVTLRACTSYQEMKMKNVYFVCWVLYYLIINRGVPAPFLKFGKMSLFSCKLLKKGHWKVSGVSKKRSSKIWRTGKWYFTKKNLSTHNYSLQKWCLYIFIHVIPNSDEFR